MGIDRLTGIENLFGSDYDGDTLTGNSGNNKLDGGSGADTLRGGLGNDTYRVYTDDNIVEAGNAGIDTVETAALSFSLSAIANVERLVFTPGPGPGLKTYTGTGNGLGNTIIGYINDDKFYGLGGNDALIGGGGDDTLDGGLGADTLTGGLGNDTYVVNQSNDVATEAASQGIDTVRSTVSWTLGANVEKLVLLGTAVNGGGNSLDNMITGNGGANLIDGKVGADRLAGGLGADRFDYNAITDSTLVADSRDIITDFNANNQDRIDLSTIDANVVAAGNNVFAFIGAAAFTGLGQVRAYQAGAFTFIDVNTTGNTVADMRIVLSGNHTLDAADFVL
jgi:Ca2+-binding RTX toxin-like protein